MDTTETEFPWLSEYPQYKSSTFFPPLLICSLWHVRTCRCFPPNNALMEWTDYPSVSPLRIAGQGHQSTCCFWWESVRRDVLSVTTRGAFRAQAHLLQNTLTWRRRSELESETVCALFLVDGSIAMLHSVPVMKGSDQYWVSRATEQTAERTDAP